MVRHAWSALVCGMTWFGIASLAGTCGGNTPSASNGGNGGNVGRGGSVGGGAGTGWGGSLGGSSPSQGAGGATGSGGSTKDDGGTPDVDAATSAVVDDVAAGTVCARLSDLQCKAEASCCKAPNRSVDACKAAMAQKCASLYLDQVSKSSVSGYSPHTAGLAMAEFQQRAATCDPTVVAWGASASGLRGIFPGTTSPGADCTPQSLLDAGDVAAHLMACNSPADNACLPGIGKWSCAPRAGVGGACFSDTNCQDGLRCDNPQTTLVGAVCKGRMALGASCTTGSQCASLVCKGAVCVPADVQAVYCLSDG
jgi:hypothetical protein